MSGSRMEAVALDECKTEDDIMGRIYEEVFSMSKRLYAVEKSLTMLVNAFQTHGIRLTKLESVGPPTPAPEGSDNGR